MMQTVPKTEIHLAELNIPLNGRYQIIEILAAKLWARTYLAQDLHRPNHPPCVIHHLKTIPIIPNYRESLYDLFAREATLLQQLGSHPQIPQLLDWFEDDNGFYGVQEFISGRSLSLDLLPQQTWQPEAVLQFLRSALEPLTWVHQHGSLHGNLKPENLRRLHNGQLLLIDFSSMGSLQQTLMTAHGMFVPPRPAAQQGYQPLEQIQGFACAGSDIYALGMIAVQALTGLKPLDFQVQPEPIKVLWQDHLPENHSPLRSRLVTLLTQMVQWELPDRYANAREVLLALDELVPIQAVVEPIRELAAAQPLPVMSRPIADTAAPILTAEATVTEVASLPRRQRSLDLTGTTDSPLVPVHAIVDATALAIAAPSRPKPSDHYALCNFEETPLGMRKFLQTTFANTPVRIGAGGIAVATTCAAVGWGLLNSVDWSKQTDQLWARIGHLSELKQNGNYRSVKGLSEKWRQDWQQAATTFQEAEVAFNQGEWAKVKALTTTLPDIPYWQDRGAALAQSANVRAETSATQQLEAAFASARQHNFTKALHELAEIELNGSVAGVVKTKTQEYRQKQNVRAWFDLQRAYDRAIARDFTQALDYLYQIPADTEAYKTAQLKIAEYKQKAQERAKAAGQSSSDRTIGLTTRSQISAQTPSTAQSGRPAIEVNIDVKGLQVNQQAEATLQLATQQAIAGQTTAALTTLEQIPLGTPAYAHARDKRVALMALQQPTAAAQAPVAPRSLPEARPQATRRFTSEPLIMGHASLQWVERQH